MLSTMLSVAAVLFIFGAAEFVGSYPKEPTVASIVKLVIAAVIAFGAFCFWLGQSEWWCGIPVG